MIQFIKKRTYLSPGWLAALAFFAVLLVTGLLIYQHYGLSWDEPTQLELGVKTYRYVIKQDPSLLAWRDRLYGPFFEILLIIFQPQGASQQIYYSRHLLTFLCFFAGCLAFFGLAKYLYKKTWLALTGALFLVLSPRIFADAFYNSKDIPFLVLYLFSLFTLIVLLDRPNLLTAAIHGLFTAALLAIRLPGMVIPALTLAGLAIEVLTGRLRLSKALWLAPLYLGISGALMVFFWPALWHDPLSELLAAFNLMKNFPHQVPMLYLSKQITPGRVPWHYIPVWLSITTPLLYLGLFIAGLVLILILWFRRPRCLLTPMGRSELIVLGALLIPLLTVIVLKSALYDAWRQMFFIYPPFLLVALRGMNGLMEMLSSRLPRRLAIAFLSALLIVGLVPTAVWMVANHPLQNVYFNRLAGPNMRAIQTRFMVDFWGLSYRQGLTYLLETDPAETIPVFVETPPGNRNAAIFQTNEELRLKFVDDLADARYYIANYYLKSGYPFKNEVYSVRVDGAPILSVFLLSDEEKD